MHCSFMVLLLSNLMANKLILPIHLACQQLVVGIVFIFITRHCILQQIKLSKRMYFLILEHLLYGIMLTLLLRRSRFVTMLLDERSAVLNILGGALLGVHNLALVLVAGLLIPVGGNSHILMWLNRLVITHFPQEQFKSPFWVHWSILLFQHPHRFHQPHLIIINWWEGYGPSSSQPQFLFRTLLEGNRSRNRKACCERRRLWVVDLPLVSTDCGCCWKVLDSYPVQGFYCLLQLASKNI